jgi:hypothetical protein
MAESKTRQLFVRLLADAVRIVFFSPVTGAFFGTLVAHVAFNSDWLFGSSVHYSHVAFTAKFGIPYGFAVGGTCGLIAYWPLRRVPLLETMLFLTGSTLGLALPLALIPGVGVPLSLIGAVVGFWSGFVMLLRRHHALRA